MRDVQCRTCVRIRQGYCDGAEKDDLNRPCEFYKRMTNADRIRNMTDEELAMLLNPTCPGVECPDKLPWDQAHDCYKCWLDYLKQEVSDD